MTKVLVLYYSAYGHIEKMAEAVAEGAREAGAEVDIKRVPELVPEEVAKNSGYKLDQAAPIAKVEDLPNYDAIIVGTGTRYGRITTYGSTSYLDDQVYPHKWIIDLALNYNLDQWTFTVGSDNVLNTYPAKTRQDSDQDGAFPYSSSSPFGFQGAFVYGKVMYHW